MTTTATHDPTLAVVRGATLITQDKGSTDWLQAIDLDSLDMDCYGFCVLGQVYGDYSIGMQTLFQGKRFNDRAHHESVAEEHGFLAEGEGAEYTCNCANLRIAWCRYIIEQRTKGGPS